MSTANSQSMKLKNMRLVMDKLIDNREITRIELSRLTKLNKATISSIISEFEDKKLVVETSKLIRTSGRSAKIFALNKNAGRIISIEILSNSIYGIISNLYGDILFELHKEVVNKEFTSYLKVLLDSIDELRSNTYESTYGLIGIGISVYGIVSSEKNIKYATFNDWKDIDLKSIIEDYTGVKTAVENEANISALSEHIAHHNQDNIAALNIGLGVGLGYVTNNVLYTGTSGYAGEIGHTIIVPNGRKCVCGNYGCLETYLSDPAVLNSYYELTNDIIKLNDLIELIKHKDEIGIKIYEDFVNYLAIAVNNISHMLNPHTITVYSKIAEEIPETLSLVKNKLRSQIMHLDVLTTSSYKGKTKVIGMTHYLILEFLNSIIM